MTQRIVAVMAETNSATEVWIQREEAWRASRQRAEAFSRREGYAASTLRWCASRLKRTWRRRLLRCLRSRCG